MGEHVGSPLLSDLVRWFKTMTTNAYIRGVRQLGWPPFPGKLWQRNYWEHVIRNPQALANIRNYIASNPRHWYDDRLCPFSDHVAESLVFDDNPIWMV